MTLDELEPYVLGKKFFNSSSPVVRIDTSALDRFVEYLAGDPIAKQLMDYCDDYRDFYSADPDIKEVVPKEQRAEVFYAAKLGEYSLVIPSYCVFYLKKTYEEASGIPNMILKKLPQKVIETFCSSGYFLGGLTLRDVICNVCCDYYTPLSDMNLKNKTPQFTEIYVKETDMVAAVPNDIAVQLSDEAIRNITLTKDGLAIGTRLLRTMSGHYGIVNSFYDLRELI